MPSANGEIAAAASCGGRHQQAERDWAFPDGKFLIVSEYGGTNAWSFMVNPDGTLWAGERYMELRAPVNRPDSGGDGMTVDQEGRPFITSHVGIQMFDATGRSGGGIAKPSDKACVSVAFAGPDRSRLYVLFLPSINHQPFIF